MASRARAGQGRAGIVETIAAQLVPAVRGYEERLRQLTGQRYRIVPQGAPWLLRVDDVTASFKMARGADAAVAGEFVHVVVRYEVGRDTYTVTLEAWQGCACVERATLGGVYVEYLMAPSLIDPIAHALPVAHGAGGGGRAPRDRAATAGAEPAARKAPPHQAAKPTGAPGGVSRANLVAERRKLLAEAAAVRPDLCARLGEIDRALGFAPARAPRKPAKKRGRAGARSAPPAKPAARPKSSAVSPPPASAERATAAEARPPAEQAPRDEARAARQAKREAAKQQAAKEREHAKAERRRAAEARRAEIAAAKGQAAAERRRGLEERRAAKAAAKEQAAKERAHQRAEVRRAAAEVRAGRQAAAKACRDTTAAHPFTPASCETYDDVCYPTKGQAVRAFLDRNRDVVEAAGGAEKEAPPAEFDAVNEKYERRGKRRVKRLGDAVAAAIPPGKPYCLDRVDLGALNETAPGKHYGPFDVPDVVHDAKLDEQYAQYLRDQADAEAGSASDAGPSDAGPTPF